MSPRKFPWPLVAAFAVMVAFGLPGLYDRLMYEHEHVGYGRIVPWGIWVAAYMFFAGMSAGAFLISTLATVFRVERFRPLVGHALWIALIALIAAVAFVNADLGRPDRGYFVMLHANLSSVMVWLGFLYSAYGAVLAAMLFLHMRAGWAERVERGGGLIPRVLALGYQASPQQETRDRLYLRVLGTLGMVVALILPGCAGALMAVVGSRPLWHSGLFPVTFVVAAIVSGGAMLYVVALLLSHGGRAYRTTLLSLGKIVGTLLAVELIILTSEILIARKGELPSHVAVLDTITQGPFSWVFWIVQVGLGTILPIGLILQPQLNKSLWTVGVACLLALTGAFAFRLNLLIPQQTLPAINFYFEAARPATDGSPLYVPTWVEWNFLVFGVGLAGLAFFAGCRLLPLIRSGQPMEFETARKRELAALDLIPIEESR